MTTQISDRELEALLLDMESDRVERKASLSDSKKIKRSICAFANDMPNHRKPGIILIGVNDDGSNAHFDITDEALLKLSDMRSNGNILPFPTMIVQKREISGYSLAVVVVEPSYNPPIRLNGRVWIRVGPGLAAASPEEEKRLAEKRRAHDQPFDLMPNYLASLDDLDMFLFEQKYLSSAINPEVLEENQRDTAQQLASLRFITNEDPPRPTNLGVLVIGKGPAAYIPGAYIQFLRIEGPNYGDPIKTSEEITGPISESLQFLDEIFKANIAVSSDITSGPLEIRSYEYPIAALQQLARNAVLHRAYDSSNAPVRVYWFSDRVEIDNPGGPYGRVNRDNFGKPGQTDYRNLYLAEAMKNLGFVQKFGYGIPTAERAMEKNGNPPLEFEVTEYSVRVTLRRAK